MRSAFQNMSQSLPQNRTKRGACAHAGIEQTDDFAFFTFHSAEVIRHDEADETISDPQHQCGGNQGNKTPGKSQSQAGYDDG